ncbi:peptide chain release factor eRF/aRF, subunit 1 [Thecamonas trahens ATCC 50062]|uniref:Eukaryotic peptide chain release factor subunit 1 n=1 Tax=Thecamonas trahens ATCC 50062 TaxID=461836 RepID=A0A0L0DIX5_THETB|nr:peptide chain release factor eRF/aRF, subunit 1 [Thecamonas trahens ATCC 50062]KNC52349.1 peptide chain release factor eRF/aRF, subunit 1 [Thecamonas trahens ATCC 50062]|eukprot:XP_013755399.1 peptide chain release factor eRF/aRF, subunit 1 [Thecamonas trahens ATCC 50062]
MADPDKEERELVEMFKMKKILTSLENARGNGTSMITLIAPPGDQVSSLTRLLTDEAGSASNIKSRVNRLSVLSAITSAQQKLKGFNQIPPNGLALYTGTVLTDDGKEKKVTYAIEPIKPLNTSMYMCDSRFHVQPLKDLLQQDDTFGFIIMDGSGALFATLSGNHRNILQKVGVELPKKHGRGGQSAVRFARLRMEARRNWVRKVGEMATKHYITDDMPNVAGLILAGSADFKRELAESELLDMRLRDIVLKQVDISYGMEAGLAQAIDQSAEVLANVKFLKEKKLIKEYFEHIAQDTGKVCYGVKDTMQAIEMGAVETLIVWEDLVMERIEMTNPQTGTATVVFLTPEQQQDPTFFHDRETGIELEIGEREDLVEWLATNYSKFGARIAFVTDRSQEGSQFCKGFGGLGGILRYRVDFAAMDYNSDDWDEYSYTSDEGAI